jgi:hypothetical protein
MQQYVETMNRPTERQRQAGLLDRIISRPTDHARLLNTFSRMEYVGVRKMLKSRRSEHLDLDGIQHMLDETIHALRLKKAALALAPDKAAVDTFSAGDTLAGDAGEAYLQAVDHAAEVTLADLGDEQRTEVNYLLSSAAIEVRAEAFYPLYEERLRAAGVPVSVAAILRDEDRHLAEMAAQLQERLPGWQARLEAVLDREATFFATFLAAVEAAL